MSDPDNRRYVVHQRVTTREERSDEDIWPTYVFLSRDEFARRGKAGDLLIVERNFGFDYGIFSSAVSNALRESVPSIIVTNVKVGFGKIQSICPSALLVFITPVRITNDCDFDREELEKVLRDRIKRRECLCPIETLVDYCSDEIAALKNFKSAQILYSPTGIEGLKSAYKIFKKLLNNYCPPEVLDVSPN